RLDQLPFSSARRSPILRIELAQPTDLRVEEARQGEPGDLIRDRRETGIARGLPRQSRLKKMHMGVRLEWMRPGLKPAARRMATGLKKAKDTVGDPGRERSIQIRPVEFGGRQQGKGVIVDHRRVVDGQTARSADGPVGAVGALEVLVEAANAIEREVSPWPHPAMRAGTHERPRLARLHPRPSRTIGGPALVIDGLPE